MVLRIPIICWSCILGSLNSCNGAEVANGEECDSVEHAIAFLDQGNENVMLVGQAVGKLAKSAPSDKTAQIATVQYFEHVARGREVPLAYARVLSQYESGFAEKVMASLVTKQNDDISHLWLTTLAMMGKKASGQAEPLAEYCHDEPDPVKQMLARIALGKMEAAPQDNSDVLEREIHNRTAAGYAAVRMGEMLGFRGWAGKKPIAEVKRWLSDDVPADYRSSAALALAVSGCQEESVVQRIRALLEEDATPDGSGYIVYAYALALLDPEHADQYWRVILKKLGSGGYNHTDVAAMQAISASLPRRHINIIEQLAKDADPEVAAGATSDSIRWVKSVFFQ